MKTGIELIAIERQEQIEKHGRTIYHDTKINSNGELKQVARYLLGIGTEQEYPRNWSKDFQFAVDRKSQKEKLIIAGALIAAELDRINYKITIEVKEELSKQLFEKEYGMVSDAQKELIDLLVHSRQ